MANSNPMGGAGGPGHTTGIPFTTTNSPARQRWKWELAIRLMIKMPNMKQAEIAQHIGVSTVTLSTWMQDPEWANLNNQIQTGILSHLDAELVEDIQAQRLTMKRLVPLALQNLADLALQSSNASIKLKATTEILDRDGHFAKVQRIGLASENQGGVSDQKDNEVANALLAALGSARKSKEETKPTILSDPISGEVQ